MPEQFFLQKFVGNKKVSSIQVFRQDLHVIVEALVYLRCRHYRSEWRKQAQDLVLKLGKFGRGEK